MDIISENLKQKYNTVLTILSNSEYKTVPDRIIFDTLTDYIIKNKNLIKNLHDGTDPEYPELNKEYFEKLLKTKANSENITILTRCIMMCKHFNQKLAEYDVKSMQNIKLKVDMGLDYIDIITKENEYNEDDDTNYRILLKGIYHDSGTIFKEEQLIDKIQDILDTIKLGAQL